MVGWCIIKTRVFASTGEEKKYIYTGVIYTRPRLCKRSRDEKCIKRARVNHSRFETLKNADRRLRFHLNCSKRMWNVIIRVTILNSKQKVFHTRCIISKHKRTYQYRHTHT